MNQYQRWGQGSKVFAILEDQSVFEGCVLSHRGLEVRIVSGKGRVKAVHARYVFKDSAKDKNYVD